MDKWYDHTPEQIAERLSADIENGLSREEAERRLKTNGPNIIYPVPKGAFKAYLGHVMTDSMSILLLLTALIQASLERSAAAIALICVLVLNYIASIIIYIKAQHVLEDTASGALPVTRVLREGVLYTIRSEQLVAGDVIFVAAGDVVPADCRLLEAKDLYAFEAPLTGIPRAQKKDASFREFREIEVKDRKNMLFASTILTRGTGKAIVVASGEDQLVCREGKAETLTRHESLPVITTLRSYCSMWSLCMIILVFLLTVTGAITGLRTRGFFDVFLTGLSLAVASMSELYTAFGYIIIASGIYNAVNQFDAPNTGALIRNVGTLEKLKDINTIIIPKEEILTLNEQSVEAAFSGGMEYTRDLPHFEKRCAMLMKFAVVSTALYGRNKLGAEKAASGDVSPAYRGEEEAIISSAEKMKLYNVALDRDYPILDHMKAGGSSRFETSLVGNFAIDYLGNGIDGISDDARAHEAGEDYLVILRGELSAVLARCRTYSLNGVRVPLDMAALNEIRISALSRSRAAYRVVGIASKTTADTDLTRIEKLQNDLNFEGYLAIREPLLPGAAKNISRLADAGIRVIMLCDDSSENNLQLAKTVGVANNSTDIISSKQMDRLSDGMLRTNIHSYRVYEGLRVDQKYKLVNFLKEEGDNVLYLGQDLDETGVMRQSGVSACRSSTISMEARKSRFFSKNKPPVKAAGDSRKAGCEALKFISDVIVSDGDTDGRGAFNALVGAISTAKVIYKNILRMVQYLITSQLSRLFIVLYSVIIRYEMMTPTQIIFTGLIVDFAAVLIIAFERPEYDILKSRENTDERLKKPFAHNMTCLAFGLFWAACAIAAPYLANSTALFTSLSSSQTGCAVFLGFIMSQLIAMNETMKDKSIFMPSVKFNFINGGFFLAIAAFVALAMLTPLGSPFGIVPLPPVGWLCALLPPAVLMLVYEIFKLISNVYHQSKDNLN
ncbi:MAG: cation transporting ATPase C-terminal domain-containing protein [Eubacteriales bacterium]|jgi:Ca2+-transporting ATPase